MSPPVAPDRDGRGAVGGAAARSNQSSLVEGVLSGENRELSKLAAAGLLPLPPRELITLQVGLADSGDAELAEMAGESLRALDPKLVADVVAEGLPGEALAWMARRLEHPLVLEAVLRFKEVPPELLLEGAPVLPEEQQEILLLRQDLIVEEPGILDALESNKRLSSYSRRRINEYRQHLLPSEAAPAVAPEEPVEPELVDEISEQEVEEAIEVAREEPAHGERDEMTGLSESQLRSLPIPVRLKLSRRAPRALRGILVRDTNPTVAVSVLKHNPMSDSEIEQIAASRSVVDDVLTAIARNRSWIRKYPIVLALVKNPRTATGVAIRLTGRLAVRDLRTLSKDKNIPHAVRLAAQRLYKIKLS